MTGLSSSPSCWYDSSSRSARSEYLIHPSLLWCRTSSSNSFSLYFSPIDIITVFNSLVSMKPHPGTIGGMPGARRRRAAPAPGNRRCGGASLCNAREEPPDAEFHFGGGGVPPPPQTGPGVMEGNGWKKKLLA